MTSAARNLGVSTPARATATSVSRQPSKLLAGLFRNIDPQHRLTVLEIGTALPETVDFFSEYRCRLHFLDLYDVPFLQKPAEPLTGEELREAFAKQFNFPADTRIDLCLFWDFISFLDDSALRAFNGALKPYVHAGTRAHGFGVHHLAVRLEHLQYGIIDQDNVSMRKRPSVEMPYHPHSQIEMADMLDNFTFERGLLLPNGKLEMLLKSTA